MVAKKASESILGLMAPSMKVTGLTTRSMVWGSTSGKTEESTSENGKTMTCKAMVFTSGLTVGSMKASTMMTRRAALVSIIGQMAESMKAGGLKGSSTVLELTLILLKAR